MIAQLEDWLAEITGYAAVFHREGDAGTEYRIGTDIVERIAQMLNEYNHP